MEIELQEVIDQRVTDQVAIELQEVIDHLETELQEVIDQVATELQEVIDHLATEHQDHQVIEVEKEINSLLLLNSFFNSHKNKFSLYFVEKLHK
jgi:gas vesicle protein